ncbi:MAG: hypothetical protein ABR886_05365 [Dehalococcoidales bacterium]|jgi:hypothetical protein
MRTLSSTLLAAQKQATAVPYVKIVAVNQTAGVNRYDWARFYAGSEDDYYHGLALAGDGSMIRVRITITSDSNKFYRQRVVSPGPESDYTQWTYLSQAGVAAAAVAALGSEVSIFYIKPNREVRRIKSTDYGATWGSAELVDYSGSTAIYGMAAAYKPNGDLAIFFADQNIFYVKKCLGGTWQAKTSWDKTTGDLSGVGSIYGGDWNLMVTGKDSAGNNKLWSLIYGDGGDVSVGTWSALKELASAPAGGNFEYKQPFLDKTDVYRCFFTEKFTGNEAYNRPFYTCTVPGTSFSDSLWREPSPFNASAEYGLAMAHYGDYGWLANPGGVWRAPLAIQSLEVTEDVIGAKQDMEKAAGSLTIELRNDSGKYAVPGQGGLAALDKGCRLEFSPGCITANGPEYSEGHSYFLESFEHTSAGGKASLILQARDGWGALSDWRARHQFRWNKTTQEASVKDIISIILARAGLKLEVKSLSSAITAFYPDFTVNPEDNGRSVIEKLLSFVPDAIFIEGNIAYLVNPQSADSAVYSYGVDHVITEGRYLNSALKINRVQAEGLDTGGAMILADRFAWDEVPIFGDRLHHVEDKNLTTVAAAQQRGDAYLRRAEIEAEAGVITIPVNCGQQLYDVIEVTDAPAGLAAVKKRVLGITLSYLPLRGSYYQRLELAAA